MTNQSKNIVKLFESLRYKHDLYTVFSDWCACAAISISNAVDSAQRDKREARYMEIVGRYDKAAIDVFPQILGEVISALEDKPQDILGTVFHDLEVSNAARGQFFTPYELCRLMARINVGSAEEVQAMIGARGFLTAHEPAVGAGATIIALAEAIQDLGVNYQQHLHVSAVDIDPRAVHMAYVQMSLLHIPAEIIVGDTLRMEFSESWYTPAHIMGGWRWKLRRKHDEPAPSPDQVEGVVSTPEIQEVPVKQQPPSQLPLFDFML